MKFYQLFRIAIVFYIAQGYWEADPPQGKVVSVSNRKRKDGRYNCKITLEVEEDDE